MKRILALACVVCVAPAFVLAQDVSAADRKRAASHLAQTRDAFLASVQGLSEAQLNFKPDPKRWSVAEVSEHIAAAEDFLMGMVKEKVMTAPARTESVDLKQIDDLVLTAIADRTKKAQAPEPLMPTKRFGGTAETLSHFKDSRAKTLAFLKDTKDLRAHAAPSPLGKDLDALQWLLFISAHCERHTKQILEVKADAGFPKK